MYVHYISYNIRLYKHCCKNVIQMCYVLQCCGHQACTYVRCLHESHVNEMIIIIVIISIIMGALANQIVSFPFSAGHL